MDDSTVVYVDPTTSAVSVIETLRRAGFSVEYYEDRASALAAVDDAVDAVVTEHDLLDDDGLSLVAEVRRSHPDTVCVVFTETPIESMTTAGATTVPNYLDRSRQGAEDRLSELLEESIRTRSHTAYPLPDDEDDRLDAVERLALETLLDDEETLAAFDRLTELAASRFGVTYAFVGLLDAHTEQFFGCHGFDGSPSPREETICTYTICEDGVYVVDEVRSDPRFQSGPYRELGVDWYAGCPIEVDGRTVGTFCLAHEERRPFDAEDRKHLRLFAEEASDQLRFRSEYDA